MSKKSNRQWLNPSDSMLRHAVREARRLKREARVDRVYPKKYADADVEIGTLTLLRPPPEVCETIIRAEAVAECATFLREKGVEKFLAVCQLCGPEITVERWKSVLATVELATGMVLRNPINDLLTSFVMGRGTKAGRDRS